MSKITSRVGERLIPDNHKTKDDYLHYLKHLFPYDFFKKDLSETMNVLEVGCGEGYGTKHISSSVNHITGIDVEKAIINHANNKYGDNKCSYKSYDGAQIPFEDNHFDAVISFQVVEHIIDDHNYIKEVKRVMKPGAKFFLTTPNREYRLKPGQKPWNEFHVREYSDSDLKGLLSKDFPNNKVVGISATEEIYNYEVNKCKTGLSKYDPLNLRKLVPHSLKKKVREVLFKKKLDNSTSYLQDYSLDNYFITKEGEKKTLDLLGIATKE